MRSIRQQTPDDRAHQAQPKIGVLMVQLQRLACAEDQERPLLFQRSTGNPIAAYLTQL